MTSFRGRILAFAVLIAAISGCACDTPPSDALESCETSVTQRSVATDILFVIDDSGSMADEQQLLRAALSRFITDLASSPIVNDYQIGVTTTSVAEFDGTATYGATPYPRGIVTAIDPIVDPMNPGTWGDFLWDSTQGFYGNRILPWDSGTLITDFQTNVLVGTNGSGREQPFAAMELALTTQAAAGMKNAAFLRPGARLAVIFLSDEDDCSGPTSLSILNSTDCANARAWDPSPLDPVSHYASFLLGPIGGETRDVVVAAIVGVTCSAGVCTNTRCSSAFATADRYLGLLGSLNPAHTRLASICDGNFDAAMADFAAVIRSRTLPLDGAPADWRMLVVTVERGAATIPCTVAPYDAPAAELDAADVVYEPPQSGRPASLTFQPQGACALEQADRIDVKVVCAG